MYDVRTLQGNGKHVGGQVLRDVGGARPPCSGLTSREEAGDMEGVREGVADSGP